MAGGDVVVAPGVYDGLSARLAARAGFAAVYATGGGISRSMGYPDLGLISMTEMVARIAGIVEHAGVPVIADADTGYGNALNARRAVRELERAGVAALHLEDQVFPKRCGHYDDKAVVPVAEMAQKLRAARDAVTDSDLVLIARTDALAVEGFERALERCKRYEEAGADMIFLEAPTQMEQLAAIPKAFRKPVLYNMASSGKTPFLPIEEIAKLGFRLVIYPNFALLSAITAIDNTLSELKRTGSIAEVAKRIASFQEFFDLVGMREVQAAEAKYGIDEKTRVAY